MELEDIPGIGEKTAESLNQMDDPESALRNGDVAAIADTPGISEGRAARLARNTIKYSHGDTSDFLQTSKAEQVYDELLQLLQERAITHHAEKRLETLYPTGEQSRIDEVRSLVDTAVEREFNGDVRDALQDVEPLAEPDSVQIRDRCVVTGDAEQYSEARDAFPNLDVELIDSKRELSELIRDYSTVILIDERYESADGEGVTVMPEAVNNPIRVVPERVIAFFAANRSQIVAALDAFEATDTEHPVDAQALRSGLEQIDANGDIVGDPEVVRLTEAIESLDAAVSDAEQIANSRMEEAIDEEEVTIQGNDLLSLAEQGGDINTVISETLSEEYTEAVDAAYTHFTDALSLNSDEEVLASDLFPQSPAYPVEHDSEVVTQLRDDLRKRRDRLEIARKQEVAEELAAMQDDVEQLVRDALTLDVQQAISSFVSAYDCTVPSREGEGFTITQGRNLLLDADLDSVEPVDYTVDDVALLSGVNSGGKTSTLELVAQTTILAHMGLPVPAESATVPSVDELHFYAKTSGTLDAGAFESTLMEFGEIARDTGGQLVLVDELESITEPGASAKIVAGVLESLHRGEATAVVVSHLAEEIMGECEFDVTVDGIRALGLQDGELQVDRSPVKNHLARSTPELIVEKLSERENNDFYEELLAKFNEYEGDSTRQASEAD